MPHVGQGAGGLWIRSLLLESGAEADQRDGGPVVPRPQQLMILRSLKVIGANHYQRE